MKELLTKVKFLKKLSLVQQLIVVLSIMALLMIAVLMPIVDYNMRSIIDDQMYESLEQSQEIVLDFSINNSYSFKNKQSKRTYHIVYDSSTRTVLNIGELLSQQLVSEFYTYLFGNDLEKLVKSGGQETQNKGQFDNEAYYYRITKYSNQSYYLISIVNNEYSTELISSLRNQIIYIQYGFFIVFALIMILWVITLINPLKKIKNYIDMIKERKTCHLVIDSEDEIGVVSKALVDMKEDLDKQEKIKEEMIHNISHDLKTPISLIKTYGQSVKDDIFPYGDKNTSMDIILENAERLDHKVKSFLYLNRLDYIQGETQEVSTLDMKQLIDKVVGQMDALKPELTLETELEDVSFIGDEEHWRVAIENIIENATRYAKTKIHIILKDKYLEIYNDGDFMDEETIPFLFDPYVKGVKGQFGLGLSIVSKVSSMYGYNIKAMNQEQGVSFVFTKK